MTNKTLTADALKEVLHYEPSTGLWTWIKLPANKQRLIGTEAGCVASAGYRVIRIHGVTYRSSRLAWLYMTGRWPSFEVDHKDTKRAHDRWGNLREATRSQNSYNTKKRSVGRSGLKGCIWSERRQLWISRITVAGKRTVLGGFDCPAASHFAYVIASDKFYSEFARVS